MPKVFGQVHRSITSIAKGLGVTLKNYTREKVTLHYPDEKPTVAERYRGLHGLTIDPETGEENCIGCLACARVCPDNLINMTLEKRDGHKGRYPVTFSIDLNPCCFCGLCSEVCPTPYKALIMTRDFELASTSRADLVLTKDKLMLYARRDQVQAGDLALDYPLLSKEQLDDTARLDDAQRAQLAAAENVQEAVAIVNPLDAKPAPAPKVERPAPAAEKPAVPDTAQVAAAPGEPVEPDYSGMDRVERAKAKAAYIKAKRAADASAAEGEAGAIVAAPAPVAVGPEPLEPDYSGMERVERAKAKAAYIKARRAWEAGGGEAAAPAEGTAAPAEAAALPSPVMAEPIEPDYTGMERVERGKAKAAYIKARRAWEAGGGQTGAADGAASAPPAEVVTPSPLVAEPIEPDYAGMERVERAKAKAVYIKARRAWEAGGGQTGTDSVADAAPAGAPAGEAVAAEPVEPDYSGMDRVERGKAKAAYIKARRAWEAGGGQALAPATGDKTDDGESGVDAGRPIDAAVTEAVHQQLRAALEHSGIAERGSGLDAGMLAEAEGLAPETQRAMLG